MDLKKVLPYILIVCGSLILLFFSYIFAFLLNMGKLEVIIEEIGRITDREPLVMAGIAGVSVIILVSVFAASVMIYAAVNILRFPGKKWTFKELVGLSERSDK